MLFFYVISGRNAVVALYPHTHIHTKEHQTSWGRGILKDSFILRSASRVMIFFYVGFLRKNKLIIIHLTGLILNYFLELL